MYRPEAEGFGKDLVIIRTPDGELRPVQMKGRPSVEWRRYGGRQIWMPAVNLGQSPKTRLSLGPHDFDTFLLASKPDLGLPRL